jgi:hypothetical protein
MIVNADPLYELPQFRPSQFFQKLRLAHHDQLQQKIFLGVHVRQHAQLFQGLDIEILRLVDHQDRPPAGRILFNEKLDETLIELDLGLALVFQFEREADPLQQLAE